MGRGSGASSSGGPPPPPDLLRQRSNSTDARLEGGGSDDDMKQANFAASLRRQVAEVRDAAAPGVLPTPSLIRQRSRTVAAMPDGEPEWMELPERVHTAGTMGPHTPRAAMETLEWEDEPNAGAPARGEHECIRVAARFRPVDVNEAELGADNLCVRFGNDGRSCTISTDRSFGSKELDFYYDHMFQPGASQEDVYVAIAQPIVEGVINGFNGAIIAYGQTGSGKTHTMLGPDGAKAFLGEGVVNMQDMGVIPRALQELLDYAAPTEGQVQLRASYVEIYQESLIDLLAPCTGGAAIRDQDRSLYLPEVTETPITSVQDALESMRMGNLNRHMAETRMNRHSSRSHAVFVVTVTNSLDRARQKFAQLYLVDLAGSERVLKTGVVGQQLEEAKQINKSLLALGQVIWALAHKQKHIPYRDSKLTRLLQNCLGGNARTAILISASPHARNANESLSALRFGARASKVQNSARVNVAEDPRELKKMLEKAREDLRELRVHCRRLQAQVTSFNVVEALPAPVRATSGPLHGQPEGPLQALTAKRLLVWGLLPSLVCPLKRAIMRDPVCAADGWSYERVAIEKHFARAGRGLPLSPVTSQRMTSRHLVPNLVVKQLVRQHLPDLAPPEVELPCIVLLQIWLVQEVLSFLDGRSLARCEAAWPNFLAAADASQVWARLLVRDFPDAANAPAAGSTAGEGGAAAPRPRSLYAESAVATGGRNRPTVAPASKGLHLVAAPKAER